MNVDRPADYKSGPLNVLATVLHVGSLIVLAEARVIDAHGTLYAHADVICDVFELSNSNYLP